jgi:hypothetical protein
MLLCWSFALLPCRTFCQLLLSNAVRPRLLAAGTSQQAPLAQKEQDGAQQDSTAAMTRETASACPFQRTVARQAMSAVPAMLKLHTPAQQKHWTDGLFSRMAVHVRTTLWNRPRLTILTFIQEPKVGGCNLASKVRPLSCNAAITSIDRCSNSPLGGGADQPLIGLDEAQ